MAAPDLHANSSSRALTCWALHRPKARLAKYQILIQSVHCYLLKLYIERSSFYKVRVIGPSRAFRQLPLVSTTMYCFKSCSRTPVICNPLFYEKHVLIYLRQVSIIYFIYYKCPDRTLNFRVSASPFNKNLAAFPSALPEIGRHPDLKPLPWMSLTTSQHLLRSVGYHLCAAGQLRRTYTYDLNVVQYLSWRTINVNNNIEKTRELTEDT